MALNSVYCKSQSYFFFCHYHILCFAYITQPRHHSVYFNPFSFLDIKADEQRACTLPETIAPVPQEIDPTKENSILFTYSVRWEVRHTRVFITSVCDSCVCVWLYK